MVAIAIACIIWDPYYTCNGYCGRKLSTEAETGYIILTIHQTCQFLSSRVQHEGLPHYALRNQTIAANSITTSPVRFGFFLHII